MNVAAAIDDAARELVARQRGGWAGARLPAASRPNDAAAGWRLQRQVSALRDTPVRGWKCALPAPDRWVVAALHETHDSGATVCAPAGRIEPEFGFVIGRDLPPRAAPYAEGDVLAALDGVRLAVEVLGCRYADPSRASGPELLADSLWHQTLVLGPLIDVLPAEPFDLRIEIDGEPARMKTARHPDRDPRQPLYWVAEFLRTQRVGLAAGQTVITGSLAGVIDVPFDRRVRLRYGTHGDIALTLQEGTAA